MCGQSHRINRCKMPIKPSLNNDFIGIGGNYMASGGIHDMNFVANVTERDIDFLVLEELQVSHAFRDWFSARVFERPVYKSHVGAWHSVVDPIHGESDLVFLFEADDGSTKAILIENKISANAQPDQGRRYTDRGEKGKAEEVWQEYQTCMIAPRRYLECQTEIYDCQISYEEVMAYFVAGRSNANRSDYRATMMLEAVKQDRRGYKQKVDDVMTAFAFDYWKHVQEYCPNLVMPVPKPRAAGNNWINFLPVGFPKSVDVVHQLSAGYLKVFFKQQAQDFEVLKARYQDLTSQFPGLEVELTSKSVAISVPVDPVKAPEVSFDAAKPSIMAALEMLSRLVQELQRRGVPS